MLFSLLTPLVLANNNCRQDVLIDDYRQAVQQDYDGALRYFNLVNADYGEVGINVTYQPEYQRVRLIPTTEDNFWFVKFNLRACFDLRGYTAIQFDMTAPTGGSAVFTLTQQAEDCITRLDDSVYTPLDLYMTPNGVRQTVVQPMSDFALNINGNPFDWVHFKDWTLVNLRPVGATFYVHNFILRGNCSTPASSSTTTTSVVAPTTSANPAPRPTQSQAIVAGAESTGLWGSVAAIALSLFA
jgi:hypothetical protein